MPRMGCQRIVIFSGGLDEFAIYDGVLDGSQVTGLRNGTVTPTTVPEPSGAVMIMSGIVLLGPCARWRRRKA